MAIPLPCDITNETSFNDALQAAAVRGWRGGKPRCDDGRRCAPRGRQMDDPARPHRRADRLRPVRPQSVRAVGPAVLSSRARPERWAADGVSFECQPFGPPARNAGKHAAAAPRGACRCGNDPPRGQPERQAVSHPRRERPDRPGVRLRSVPPALPHGRDRRRSPDGARSGPAASPRPAKRRSAIAQLAP